MQLRASARGTLPQPLPTLRRSAASGLTRASVRGGSGRRASAAACALPLAAHDAYMYGWAANEKVITHPVFVYPVNAHYQ